MHPRNEKKPSLQEQSFAGTLHVKLWNKKLFETILIIFEGHNFDFLKN